MPKTTSAKKSAPPAPPVQSRSVAKRIAAQKGEPPPTFDAVPTLYGEPASVVPEEFRKYLAAAVWMPLALLKRWLRNAALRDNDVAVPAVAESIKRFGFVAPICIWTSKNEIRAGHTRLSAMELLLSVDPNFVPKGAPGPGLVPVRFHEFASEAEATAYALADNRLAELARFREEGVREVLTEFREERELFAIAGFSREEWVPPERGERSARGDADDVPPGPDPHDALTPATKEPRCKAGDLWHLGTHRLLCGDSFKPEDTARLLAGDGLVDAVVTDSPYAIYGSSTGIGRDIADDKMVRPFFESLGRACAMTVKTFGHIYVCCDWRSWAAVWHGMHAAQLSPKNCIVWDKGNGLGNMYAQCHELVGFFVREPTSRGVRNGMEAGHRTVMRKNVIQCNRVTGDEREHCAQKPVALFTELVTNSTDVGQKVVDWFGGAGTTLVVCETLGRVARVMEIEPRECDKILARWEKLTGKTAELQGAQAIA